MRATSACSRCCNRWRRNPHGRRAGRGLRVRIVSGRRHGSPPPRSRRWKARRDQRQAGQGEEDDQEAAKAAKRNKPKPVRRPAPARPAVRRLDLERQPAPSGGGGSTNFGGSGDTGLAARRRRRLLRRHRLLPASASATETGQPAATSPPIGSAWHERRLPCAQLKAAAPHPRDFDLLVIGSGPAGQKAAIQAAKLGKRVRRRRAPAHGRRRLHQHRHDPVEDAARGGRLPDRHVPARALRRRATGSRTRSRSTICSGGRRP